MMKKILAGLLVVYMIFMGYVVLGGFIKKQSLESKAASGSSATNTGNSSSSSSSASSATKDSSKIYSTSDVSAHHSRQDCWLIINSKVYNVSDFIDQHPGGAANIIRVCGKDATTAFETQDGRGGHSSQANAMLADYLIGTVQ